MDISAAYLIGNTRYSFRRDEPAKITGVVVVKPKRDQEPRLCFQVEFEDGRIDYSPVSEFYDGNMIIKHSLDDAPLKIEELEEKEKMKSDHDKGLPPPKRTPNMPPVKKPRIVSRYRT